MEPSRSQHPPLSSEQEALLIELALAHRIEGRLHANLSARAGRTSPASASEPTVSDAALERLKLERQRAGALHLLATRSLRRTAEALNAACVDWVVVKGPAIAKRYAFPDQRRATDLDIVVRRADFGTAFAALEQAGFESINRNWGGFIDHGIAETPLRHDHAIIDLHWHIVGLAVQRHAIPVDVDAMLDRRRALDPDVAGTTTFDDEDTLLHQCLHAALGGGRRLVWFADIDALIRTATLDWDTVAERATANRQRAITATMLSRCHQLFGTPLPADLPAPLRPTRTIRVTESLINRAQRSDDRRLNGWQSGLLLAAERDSVTATAAALGRSIRHEAAARRGRPTLTDGGGALDWHTASGGARGRRRWLDYVASERP